MQNKEKFHYIWIFFLLRTSIEILLCWFQYRLIHKIIPVGSYLKKIQIKPTETCTLCKEAVETIALLFFECEKATYLWNELHCRILDVIHGDVNFTLQTVLFGERSYTCNKPINIILLATKKLLSLYMLHIPTKEYKRKELQK